MLNKLYLTVFGSTIPVDRSTNPSTPRLVPSKGLLPTMSRPFFAPFKWVKAEFAFRKNRRMRKATLHEISLILKNANTNIVSSFLKTKKLSYLQKLKKALDSSNEAEKAYLKNLLLQTANSNTCGRILQVFSLEEEIKDYGTRFQLVLKSSKLSDTLLKRKIGKEDGYQMDIWLLTSASETFLIENLNFLTCAQTVEESRPEKLDLFTESISIDSQGNEEGLLVNPPDPESNLTGPLGEVRILVELYASLLLEINQSNAPKNLTHRNTSILNNILIMNTQNIGIAPMAVGQNENISSNRAHQFSLSPSVFAYEQEFRQFKQGFVSILIRNSATGEIRNCEVEIPKNVSIDDIRHYVENPERYSRERLENLAKPEEEIQENLDIASKVEPYRREMQEKMAMAGSDFGTRKFKDVPDFRAGRTLSETIQMGNVYLREDHYQRTRLSLTPPEGEFDFVGVDENALIDTYNIIWKKGNGTISLSLPENKFEINVTTEVKEKSNENGSMWPKHLQVTLSAEHADYILYYPFNEEETQEALAQRLYLNRKLEGDLLMAASYFERKYQEDLEEIW